MSFAAPGPGWNHSWSNASQWTPGWPPQHIYYGAGPRSMLPNGNQPSPNPHYLYQYAPQSPPLDFRPFPYADGPPFLPPMGAASQMPMVPFFPMQMHPAMSSTDIQPIVFAKKDPCDCECLAARPSDWRHDYTPPRRFKLPTPFRRTSGDRTKINLEHSHLCPTLLMPNSRMPVMSFDLRSDDFFDPSNLELLTIDDRPFNRTDLIQFATTRPVSRLRFYHPRLPWYFDVRASQPNGVLVADVLQQLHAMLHWPIRQHDFSNVVLNAADRELITGAYRSRCDVRVDLLQQGVRRVDFLGASVILQGFLEGKDGMWLIKTTSFSRNM
ncbi:hypothetical protein B0H12DRAFT_289711 [Mycena haematopus]|nr:hypothetical protein B0H12DRAFT_289711 [Mycena haematopus]